MAALNFLTQNSGVNNSASFERIGNLLVPSNTVSARSDAENLSLRIFEDFISQTQKREELLLQATEEQIDIFKQLEDAIGQLKDSGIDNYKQLSQSIKDLGVRLQATPRTPARDNISRLLFGPAAAVPQTSISNFSNTYATPAAAAATASIQPRPAFAGSGVTGMRDEGEKEKEADPGILGMMTMLDGLTDLILGLTGGKFLLDKLGGLFPGGANKQGGRGGARGNSSAGGGIANRGNKPSRTPPRTPQARTGGGGLLAGAGSMLLGAGKKIASTVGAVATSPVTVGLGALLYSPELGGGSDEILEPDPNNPGQIRIKPEIENQMQNNKLIQPGQTVQTSTGAELSQVQAQNTSMQLQKSNTPAAPVIINNQTPIINNSAPQFLAPAAQLRPTESSLLRYQNRESFFN